MFWGLIMEPKRRYTQVVKRPFHVSMAALDIFSSNDSPCQVLLNFEDRNYLLCTLQKDNNVQMALDLNFEAGSVVAFATNGESNIHLTGYLIDEDNLEDLDEDESEEEEDTDIVSDSKKRKKAKALEDVPRKKSRTEQLLDEADNYDSNDDESFSISQIQSDEDDEDGDSDLLDDSDENDDEEEDEDGIVEEDNEDDDELDEDEVSSMSETEEEKPQVNGVTTKKKQKQKSFEEKPRKSKKAKKQEKGKDGVKVKEESIQKTPKGDKSPKASKSPQKRVIEGGVIIEDVVVGQGQVVKPGKLAEVYYEGRLKQNNKVFDKLRQGAGFKFRVGKQEVIRGWDVGVAGMKVGGKRRIVCPPNMAYGAKGSAPQIPPNSTLLFEVELKNVK